MTSLLQEYPVTFAKQKHFGSVLIMGRSGWGKTWLKDRILSKWEYTSNETVVTLDAENYTSWNKWTEATTSITAGRSVFARLYNRIETYVIEDIHNTFFWSSSVRLKFLEQIRKIASHSNIIITMDIFGSKIPKVWTASKSWNQMIRMNPPSIMSRMNFCKNDPVLSKLNESQLSYILEVTKDISFRTLQRVSRFLEQSQQENKQITFSVLRQATSNVSEVYLPPGLFENAKKWIVQPKMSIEELEMMYIEDPFHFPYLIWNMLPRFCYHNGRSFELMIENYLNILNIMMHMDDPDSNIRGIHFAQQHHYFHKGWLIRESVIFQIPNIRNKVSYSKVRKKALQAIVDTSGIPSMFVLDRFKEDPTLKASLPKQIASKIKI